MLKREKRRAAELVAAAKQAGINLPEPSAHTDDLFTDRSTATGNWPEMKTTRNGDVFQQDRSTTVEGSSSSEINVRPSSRLRERHYQVLNESGKSSK